MMKISPSGFGGNSWELKTFEFVDESFMWNSVQGSIDIEEGGYRAVACVYLSIERGFDLK